MKHHSAVALAILLVLTMPSQAAEIAIVNSSPLVFGSFAAGSGGTITVSTSGMCSAGGSVIMVVSDCAAAGFTITGDPNFTYIIDLPADNFVTLTGPGSDMTITNFTSDPEGANGLLSAGGEQNLSVGGTLNVSNNQASGTYSGSFTVIVNYN